jgi:hypothetical protein
MKISTALIMWGDLKPHAKETFLSGVKLGLWIGGICAIIMAIIVHNLIY